MATIGLVCCQKREHFNAHNFVFCADYAFWYGFVGRNIGHSVRPVKNPYT